MKKLVIILGSVMLIAAIAYPVFAWGPGMGRGQGFLGNRGGGPGYCWRYDRGDSNLTQEQQGALDQLNERFFKETDSLRKEIWAKSDELNNLLNAPDPDAEKAKALHKEIIDLRGKMAEKRLDFSLEERKINPDARFGGGYGRGYGRHMKGYGPRAGMGYGRHMKGYGPRAGMGYGRHMGDYGQGPCWN